MLVHLKLNVAKIVYCVSCALLSAPLGWPKQLYLLEFVLSETEYEKIEYYANCAL